MQFDVKTVNNILGIDDSFKAPACMMELLLDSKKRVEIFNKFLEISNDMSFDWFHEYYEDEQAERKSKKQDFTPECISEVLAGLTENSKGTYYEPAAGTGGILIKRWWHDRNTNPVVMNHLNDKYSNDPIKGVLPVLFYDPRSYWYRVEELSDRSIPFLIFNMAIRGMNGVVVQCNSLSREAKDVYFIRNDTNDFFAFSDVIKMPHTEELKNELQIEWIPMVK
ncbi:N-6 DNA methylase [Lactobacillus taiwanensis]|uniref:N-6 DNA methylase n=1 Tax=Lactobacillus taiwanensis TaxID=508451 RepID=UPI001AEBDB60|nr:N-6 DNA methylase [Lactobacillus taiwanensis]QTQ40838.1 SAM-dependent DNA methyltransferase [Lactobacillus taiwanensis]